MLRAHFCSALVVAGSAWFGPAQAAPGLDVVPQLAPAEVRGMAFSPDGRHALQGDDGHLNLWDLSFGMLLKVVPRGEGASTLGEPWAMSPSGVVALLEPPELYDLERGRRTPLRVDGQVGRGGAFSPDGRRVVVGYGRGEADDLVVVWNATTGAEEKRLRVDHRINRFGGIEVLPDGRHALVVAGKSSEPSRLELWDLDQGRLVHTFVPPKGVAGPISLSISRDGRRAAVGYVRGQILVWDVASRAVVQEVRAFDRPLAMLVGFAVALSPSGELLAGAELGGGKTKVWDVATGRALCEVPVEADRVGLFEGGRLITSRSEVGVWDATSGAPLFAPSARRASVRRLAASGSEVFAVRDRAVVGWDVGALALSWTRELEATAQSTSGAVRPAALGDLALSPRGDALGVVGGDQLFLLDAATGALRWQVPSLPLRTTTTLAFGADASGASGAALWTSGWAGGNPPVDRYASGDGAAKNVATLAVDVRSPRFVDAGKLVLGHEKEKRAYAVLDASTGKLVRELPIPADVSGVDHAAPVHLSGSGRTFAAIGSTLLAWAGEGSAPRRLELPSSAGAVSAMTAAPDEKSLVLGTLDGRLLTVDAEKLALVHDHRAATEPIHDVAFGGLPHLVFAGTGAGGVVVWNLDRGTGATFVSQGADWILYTDDGYFDASREGGRLLVANRGLRGYRIDQVAVQRNRPDILFERLGLGSPELVAHYRARHERRLRKLGLDEATLDLALATPPEARIARFEPHGDFVDLEAALDATAGSLVRANVFVNDVPLFGAAGKAVSGPRATLRERIELTAGTNKIEVSTVDDRGVESLRPFRVVEHQKRARGDLYFLGFGVSRYQNPKYDLRYPHKDVLDLAEVFRGADSAFDRVHVRTYVNEEATKDAITEAKAFFAGAKVDDTVVLLVAGHGAHTRDAAADYYFVTHETDAADLARTGARFEDIELLLQGIAPRRKLFLLDTCESGERDPAEEATWRAAAGSRGLSARSTRSLEVEDAASSPDKPRPKPRPFVLNEDRYIDTDLARRSGAIVLSSSRGSELSWEKEELQNGVFTEAVLEALVTPAADADGDGTVSTDELRSFVATRVEAFTGGAQHPRVDRDNVAAHFGFPVVAAKADVLHRPDPLPPPAAQAPPGPPKTPTPAGCGCQLPAKVPTRDAPWWLVLGAIGLGLRRTRRGAGAKRGFVR